MHDDKILFKDECYAIQGAIFEVYRVMGCGFLEAVYQECLAREFAARNISCVAQPDVRLHYKGALLEQKYQPDFICHGQIILEVKAVKELTPVHQAQVLNYLKATQLRVGLLVNFGAYPKAAIQRFVL